MRRRVVLAFGAFPAICTFYFRSRMPETPRYSQLVEGKAEETAKAMAEVTRGLDDSLSKELAEQAASSHGLITVKDFTTFSFKLNMIYFKAAVAVKKDDCETFWQFLQKYGVQLFGTASCWFFLDISFYSQNLFQKDVFTQVGFLPPAKYMYALEEAGQVAKAQALIALGSTIPGYWFTVFFVDIFGRIKIQAMGFFLMTAFMFAMAGAYLVLLNPNDDDGDVSQPTGQSTAQPTNRNGWIAMFVLLIVSNN